jgi:integrase
MVGEIRAQLGKKSLRENHPPLGPRYFSVARKTADPRDHGAKSAHRIAQNRRPGAGDCAQSLAKLRAEFSLCHRGRGANRDISADLKVALPPAKLGHFAAVTDPKKIGSLLRAIDAFEGTFPAKCTLKLAPLVFIRPGELRTAGWEHIDLDRAGWCYTVTKTNAPRVLPLSMQAGEIFKELHPLTGHGCCAFPLVQTLNGDKPMSDNGI